MEGVCLFAGRTAAYLYVSYVMNEYYRGKGVFLTGVTGFVGPRTFLEGPMPKKTSTRVKDELLGWSQDRKCLRSTKYFRCFNFLKVRRRRSSWQLSADGAVHGGRVARISQSKQKCWTDYSYIELFYFKNCKSSHLPKFRLRTEPKHPISDQAPYSWGKGNGSV